MCQMKMNGKLQIRHHLVYGVRIGKRLGVVAVGSAFKLIEVNGAMQRRDSWTLSIAQGRLGVGDDFGCFLGHLCDY